MKTLLEKLEAISGFSTLTATRGLNGNGGLYADVDDLLSGITPDEFALYEKTKIDPIEFVQDFKDATGKVCRDSPEEYEAWDYYSEDAIGVYTGEIFRIYIYIGHDHDVYNGDEKVVITTSNTI